MIGSGIGGLNTIADTTLILEKSGPRRVSPFFIPAALINLASGQVSIRYGFKGPNHAVVTACSTGAHAIGDAARMIKLDDADVMVAGRLRGGARAGSAWPASPRRGRCRPASTTRPERASRPWDKDRDGFVMAEGAGCVVLEEYEHAKRRGAKIYAEVKGYGLSGDAYHVTAPSPGGDGGFRSMQAALKRSGLRADDIDYINAHGTSTPLGDEIEFGAVKRLFGNAVAKLSMSSTKSAIGHLLGAAGAVEAIFCILAMRDQIVPPTLNLDDPSEGCGDIDLVPHKAKEREVQGRLVELVRLRRHQRQRDPHRRQLSASSCSGSPAPAPAARRRRDPGAAGAGRSRCRLVSGSRLPARTPARCASRRLSTCRAAAASARSPAGSARAGAIEHPLAFAAAGPSARPRTAR